MQTYPEDDTSPPRADPKSAAAGLATAILVVYVTAIALWAGGLVVLGAIVAPAVFGIVPAPASADAMTVVFRRFDVIALACAVIALLSEVLLARLGRSRRGQSTRGERRSDAVRVFAIAVASLLAIVEGTYLAPAIHALHRDGATRGVGESGLALERLHEFAETAAKTEVLLLFVVLVFVVLRSTRVRGATV